MAVPPCYPFSARGTGACCRTSSPKNAAMSLAGPTLPTWTVPQVGSYLRYTGRDANIVAEAALDPKRCAPGSWQRIGGASPPRGRSSQPPRPRVMHEVLLARAAVKRSQGRPWAKY